jgi:hypothetical protein
VSYKLIHQDSRHDASGMAESEPVSTSPVQSFTKANKELGEAFERYLISRGFSAPTLRAYMDSVNRYIEMLGSMNVVDAERREIREFQAGLLKRGLSSNSLRLHTIALRGFHKFIRLPSRRSIRDARYVRHRNVAKSANRGDIARITWADRFRLLMLKRWYLAGGVS